MSRMLARVPWVSALYVIFIGLVWILNAGIVFSHPISAPMIYEAGQDVLTEARKGLTYLQNEGPGDLTEHRVAYGDLQRILMEYKSKYMDRTPSIVYAICGIAIITSLLYVGSGIMLFCKNLGGAWVAMRCGMIGVFSNYSLMFFEYYQTGHRLNVAVERLLQVFGIKEGLGGIPREIIIFAGGIMLAAFVFYIVVPLLIHQRLSHQSALPKTKSETEPVSE